jgi:ADP-ribose pyrophosphatase YjhB (NUDIX family)
MVEHHIEKELIDRLMFADGLRFSELKPAGMESNIFMYHLNSLIKSNLVIKKDSQYKLSSKGLTYVDSISSQNLKPRKQPKIITIIAVRDKDNSWLLLQRKFQPYIGQFMFPSGKQHFGENIANHAKRELMEKTGLNTALLYRGIANIQISKDNDILTHVIAHIHSGVVDDVAIPAETSKYRYILFDFNNHSYNLMPGTREIYDALENGNEVLNLNLELNAN